MSSTSNLIRFGKNGSSGSFDDNWLPVYGGEVLTAFEEFNQFLPRVNFRSIASGNEAEFPQTWKIGSEYHEAGTELLGLDVETSKFTLTLDDRPLVSHFEVDDIDVAMSHYDVRSEFASQVGQELARVSDKNIAILLIKAASEAARGSHPTGTDSDTRATTGHANLVTIGRDGATAVLNAIEDACIYAEENDAPKPENCCVVPGMWYAIRNLGVPQTAAEITSGITPVFPHADWNPAAPKLNVGSMIQDELEWNGVKIIKSNHLPVTVSSGTITGKTISTGPTRYQGTFTNTTGVIWSSDAVAALQLANIRNETMRDVRRGTDFMVSRMLMGGGTLRGVCSYTLDAA